MKARTKFYIDTKLVEVERKLVMLAGATEERLGLLENAPPVIPDPPKAPYPNVISMTEPTLKALVAEFDRLLTNALKQAETVNRNRFANLEQRIATLEGKS